MPFETQQIGDCTLYRGDALEVMPTLESGSVDMIWTDPPYGHSNNAGDLNAALASGAIDGRGYTKPDAIANDDADSMRVVVDGMLTEAARVLSPDCCCCCCCCCGGGPRPTFAWLAERMDRDGLAFFHSVIWDKKNPGLGWRYRRQHEMVMVAHRKNGKLLWQEDRRAVPNIVSIAKMADGGDIDWHPNLKPLSLITHFVQIHSSPGHTILDPFMGSGTTGVACARMGRKFIGVELEPKYFDIACRRVEKAYAQPYMFIATPTPAMQQDELL